MKLVLFAVDYLKLKIHPPRSQLGIGLIYLLRGVPEIKKWLSPLLMDHKEFRMNSLLFTF